MRHNRTYRHWLSKLVLFAYCLSLPSAYANEAANEREYYTSNKENRFLLKIHIWGDIPLSGIHHVPDNATLLDVIGYAGGPAGIRGGFSSASITLNRKLAPKDQATEITIDGKNLVRKAEFRNMRLINEDVIYVETPKPDTLLSTLTIIGTVLGIISTSATLYLLATR